MAPRASSKAAPAGSRVCAACGPTSFRLIVAALAAIALSTLAAAAQQPGQAITIVVPYTPGTGPDILARLMGEEIEVQWGQPVVVENKPGASGNIGTQVVARAPADGNTLLTTSPFTQNISLFKSVPCDPVGDFAPIVHLSDAFMALAVHPSLPVSPARGFVAYLKAHRGQGLRLAGLRHAAPPLHGALQARHGNRPQARRLSRLGAGRAGPGGRPHRHHVHAAPCRPAVGQGQPDPAPGGGKTTNG